MVRLHFQPSIDDRHPAIIATIERAGGWRADLVGAGRPTASAGRAQSTYALIAFVKLKGAQAVLGAMAFWLTAFSACVNFRTTDKSRVFALH